MRAFITGADGFIGRALSRELRAAGHEVAGVDLAGGGEEIVGADVSEPGQWQAAASGADVVFHTAAVVSLRLEDPAGVWRANVLGTRNALDAAVRAGARFVHLSSVTVFGMDFPDGVDELHPVRPAGVPYIDTKIAAEQVVLQAHAEGRADVRVARPGDVYGPGSRAWAVLPVEHMKAGRFVLPRGGIFSPVHIDDLVRGLIVLGETDAAAGHVITLSSGAGVPNETFFGPYAEAVGRPLRSLPLSVLRPMTKAVQMAMRARPGDNDVNPRAMEYMARRGTYSIARAKELLGWEPRVDLDEGLAGTVAWLREAGHLG